MPTKIGHFEILSELAKSPTGTVYKANDPESGQTIALKAIQLSAFGQSSEALEHALLAEAESTKVLSSPNITKVYGAGEIEGQFCAAMDYVQGNSIATMLARKEGFSIWDLLDIGRQLSAGLDHASSHQLVHYSLEPAKIMCGWDGTVKILSFGVSSVGKFVHHAQGLSPILYYMSPEQIRGEATDGRSNLYSLAAMFYEMVTEQKPFERDDVENLQQCILETIPAPPVQVNPKIHPLLSDLIMKALSKDPAQRYQNGRELLDDLEKCKEMKPAKKVEAPKATVAPPAAKASAQSKFVSGAPSKSAAPSPLSASKPAARIEAKPSTIAKPVTQAQPAGSPSMSQRSAVAPAAPELAGSKLAQPVSRLSTPKAAAAASGANGGTVSEAAEIDLTEQFASPSQTRQPSATPSAVMSAAAVEQPEVETFEPEASSPKVTVDPMMAEGGAGAGAGTSFSEISELPPLKEVYVAPPPPPAEEVPALETPAASYRSTGRNTTNKDEKPKVQPREAAQKAIKEIKGVPPKLYAYSIGIAAAIILAIGIGVVYYIHSQGGDDDAGAPRNSVPAQTSAQPETTQPAATPVQPEPAPVVVQPADSTDSEPEVTHSAATPRARSNGRKKGAAAPIVIPGQLALDSTPQGAQVQIDGASDPSWVTPFTLTNLQPGRHSIVVTKPGYSSDSRTIDVTSGNRATATIRLSQIMATLVVKSDPAGASIYVDGRDVGIKTPAQISVDKGQHVVLVRMSGYLDETMSTQFALGQTFNFSPTLKPLGNTDSIKTAGGKMSRLFGKNGGQAGQASVTIHTQPKGAQISINQHMIEKNTPVDVWLDPGNYEVEITLSGYAPIRRVVSASKGGKVVIDEVLQQQ